MPSSGPRSPSPASRGDSTPREVEERAASAGGAAQTLRITRTLAIPVGELRWRFSTSGGPGGQHANRTASRVEVQFDVTASRSLGPRQRARILERLGPVVHATASDERSQARNRQLAMQRLAERLADVLRAETPRRPTRPTEAAVRRRLEDKRRRGRRKEERQRPSGDGEA